VNSCQVKSQNPKHAPPADRLVALILISVLLIAELALDAGSTWGVPFGPGHGQALAKPELGLRCPGELFFGHSEDVEETLGWLICLDQISKTGTIYEPPGMLRLRVDHWDEHGQLRFKSLPFADENTYYSFDGKSDGQTLSGKLERIRGTTSTTEKIYEIEAARMADRGKSTRLRTRYSNIEYVEQAGELLGAEVILFRESSQIRGVITFYGHYWGQFTYSPLLLTKVSEEGTNRIGFVLHSRLGSRTFSMTLSREAAILSPKHLESWEEPSRLFLKKVESSLPPPRNDISAGWVAHP